MEVSMMPSSHLEGALSRIRRIVCTASQADAPLTEHEAVEQIVEELELAGFGAPEMDPALEAVARELASPH
jgi:hypothetical protein